MAIVLVLMVLMVSACARHLPLSHVGPMPARASGSDLHGALIDLRAQRFVAFDTLVSTTAHTHVIALGEEHYHPAIQAFELRLLRALAAQRPQRLALGMEFLEGDAQPAVDAYLAGRLDQIAFQERLQASASFMRLYFPLLQYAQQAGLPVIAMNVPRRISRQVARDGLEQTLKTLDATDQAYLPASVGTISEPYRTYFLDAVADAHPVQGEQAERFVAASHLKDVTMATSLARFLEKHPDFTILAIAGRFHFDYGIAIPSLLQQQAEHITIRRITVMGVTPRDKLELNRFVAETLADYLQIFPPAPEEN